MINRGQSPLKALQSQHSTHNNHHQHVGEVPLKKPSGQAPQQQIIHRRPISPPPQPAKLSNHQHRAHNANTPRAAQPTNGSRCSPVRKHAEATAQQQQPASRHQPPPKAGCLLPKKLAFPPPTQQVRMCDRVYKAKRRLGRGQFGEVLEVLDVRTDEKLVVKRLLEDVSGKDLQEALREVSLLARLRHPHIVSLFGSWFELPGNRLHMAMEPCWGGDLHTFNHQHFPLPEPVVRGYAAQLLLALSAVHKARVLHRDLKPANIFLADAQQLIVKIGDFGVSRMLQSNEYAHTYAGTPLYMSPEMARGDHYTHKSDMWSFGVVMFELLTNEPLWDAPCVQEFSKRLVMGNLPDVRARAHPSFSDELCHFVQCILVRRQERRPSAKQLLGTHLIVDQLTNEGGPTWGSLTPATRTLIHSRPAAPVRIRDHPSLGGQPIGKVEEGDVIIVEGGGIVVDNTTWLHVIVPMDGFCVSSWLGKNLFLPFDPRAAHHLKLSPLRQPSPVVQPHNNKDPQQRPSSPTPVGLTPPPKRPTSVVRSRTPSPSPPDNRRSPCQERAILQEEPRVRALNKTRQRRKPPSHVDPSSQHLHQVRHVHSRVSPSPVRVQSPVLQHPLHSPRGGGGAMGGASPLRRQVALPAWSPSTPVASPTTPGRHLHGRGPPNSPLRRNAVGSGTEVPVRGAHDERAKTPPPSQARRSRQGKG